MTTKIHGRPHRRVTVDELIALAGARIRDELGDADLADEAVEPAIQAAIDALISTLPDHDDPNDQIGPYYDTSGLRRRLGISRQAISQRVDRNTLLGVETDDGSILYPVCQFNPDMTVIPGLAAVLKELHRVAEDGFSKAVWLTTPDDNYSGMSAIQWLRDTGDITRVLADARADVERLVA